MYCRNCGKKLSDVDKFCYNCGTTINKENDVNNMNLVDKYNGGTEEDLYSSITSSINSFVDSEYTCNIDPYFVRAGCLIIANNKGSIGMLQREFKIGFNQAARLMDQLAEAGVVGEENGTKPRKVLMSMHNFENYCRNCGYEFADTDEFRHACRSSTERKNKDNVNTDERVKRRNFNVAWLIVSLLIVSLLDGNFLDSFLLGVLGSLIFHYVSKNKKM